MTTSIRARSPVRVFISYAREDSDHCRRLVQHLGSLAHEGHVRLFYDRQIPAGDEWDPRIEKELRQAEIILLLLTRNFTSSAYILEKEVPLALDLHEKNDAVVIPVQVDYIDWDISGLKRLNAVPDEVIANRKKWDSPDQAWLVVADRVRERARYVRSARPVSEVLEGVDEVVSSGRTQRAEGRRGGRTQEREFPDISAFWRAIDTLPKTTGLLATVQGTFSRLAPMMVGPPKAKRRLHREFRTALEQHKEFGRVKLPTINACMSISAGQMVQLAEIDQADRYYFGLYGSIVRNSVPILVWADYYRQYMEQSPYALNHHCCEAVVAGRVIRLDNTQLQRYVARYELNRFISDDVIGDLVRNAVALEVGGPGSGVKYLGPPRYLDGDIWFAVESDGEERFITTFLDLADPADREEARAQLRADHSRLTQHRIIARWDEEESEFRQFLQKTLKIGLSVPDQGEPG